MVGAGGGTALLLLMLYLLPTASVIPVHGCIQLVSNTTRVALFWQHMQWGIILRFTALMPIGVAMGLALYHSLEASHIRLAIAGFILLSLFFNPNKLASERRLPPSAYFALGLFIGFANMIVGVLAPFLAALLRLERLPKEQMVGTLGFFGFAGNLFKIAGFAFVGFSFAAYLPVIIPACLASIARSYLGKKILTRTSHKTFTIAFQLVIFLLAMKMIFDSIS